MSVVSWIFMEVPGRSTASATSKRGSSSMVKIRFSYSAIFFRNSGSIDRMPAPVNVQEKERTTCPTRRPYLEPISLSPYYAQHFYLS